MVEVAYRLNALDELSADEMQTLAWIREGLSDAEIAARSGVTEAVAGYQMSRVRSRRWLPWLVGLPGWPSCAGMEGRGQAPRFKTAEISERLDDRASDLPSMGYTVEQAGAVISDDIPGMGGWEDLEARWVLLRRSGGEVQLTLDPFPATRRRGLWLRELGLARDADSSVLCARRRVGEKGWFAKTCGAVVENVTISATVGPGRLSQRAAMQAEEEAVARWGWG